MVSYGPNFKDLTNQRFGRLIALNPADRTDDGKRIIWSCRCDCGNQVDVVSLNLTNGDTQSCGCLKKEVNKINLRDQYDNKRVDGVAMHLFDDKARKDSSTGYRGVFKYKTRVSRELRYGASITVNKKRYTKRGFLTPEDAYYNGRLKLEEQHLPEK